MFSMLVRLIDAHVRSGKERGYVPAASRGFMSALPLHDRYGADRIRWRAIDYLGADREVDERVPRFVHHAINTGRFEEDAGFLAEHLFVFGQLRQIDVDWTDLSARDRKIRRIFVQAERLAPAAFSSLRDMARYAGDPRIVKHADAHLVVGRERLERG